MSAAARVVVALGSNLGDRETHLRAAVAELEAIAGIEVFRVSSLHETVAVTVAGADAFKPPYLNAVALVSTTLEPEPLLDVLNGIEARHGRERTEHWGDRTLDLDIVEWEGVERADERLTLPHPRAAERDFVLRPWLEVDPDAALTGIGPVAPLLAAIERAAS